MTLAALVEPAEVVLLDFDGPLCHLFGTRAAARVVADLRELVADHGIDGADPLGVLRSAVRLAPAAAGAVESAFRVAEVSAAATAETTSGAFDVVAACVHSRRTLAVSALAGTAREAGPRQTVTVEPGTYRVRVAYVEPDDETAVVLTQLVPV